MYNNTEITSANMDEQHFQTYAMATFCTDRCVGTEYAFWYYICICTAAQLKSNTLELDGPQHDHTTALATAYRHLPATLVSLGCHSHMENFDVRCEYYTFFLARSQNREKPLLVS